ncbi:uncharacterized protein [Apostichopus japonicus]|uniref:uncharacterized protein isoform X4 n=1 Tax=Stichopus japonicus TaxID=307972 RepID=UPI003AB8B423
MAGRDNTPNGFGAFKVYMASQLTGSQIAQLSTFFDFSRALFDKVEGNGLAFVNTLVDRGTIDETDISRLLEALEVIKLCGIQKRFQKKFRSCMEVATQDEPSPTQKGELSKTNTHGNFSTGKRQDDTKPVFISFSSKDKTKVEEIVATFEEALGPKTCWMYTTGIQGGQNIDREIVRAVDKAKVVICMISQTYIDSDECEKEVMLAVNRKKEIIEVRIESVNRHYKDKHGDESAVELTFARRSYIDLTGEDMEKKMQELIKRIQELISQEDNQSTEEQVPSPLKPSPTPEGGKPSKTSTDGEQVPSPLKPSPTPEEGEPSKTSTDEEQVPSPLKPSPTPEGGEPSKTSTDEEQVPSPLKPSPTPEGGEPSKTSTDEAQVPSPLKPSPSLGGGEPSKTSTDDVTKPVFISFSYKDLTKVENFVATFEEVLGPKTCWMCTTGIKGGQNIDRQIVRALAEAKVVVCMISQDYIDSNECEKEVMLAEHREKEIIAVHIESVQRPYQNKDGGESALQLRFARHLYMNLTGEDMEKKMQELIARIKELISQEDNQSPEQVPSPLKPSPALEGGEPSKTSADTTETKDSQVIQYSCAYCKIIFKESWQQQYHTETEKHKGNINIKKDDEKWAYGEPPLGITDGKFKLCPKQSRECSGCPKAHSRKQLDEWNKRHEYRLEALYNYQQHSSEDMTDQTSKMKKLVEKYEEEKQKDSKHIKNVGNISYLKATDQIIAKGSEGALIYVGKYKDAYVAVKRIQIENIQREEEMYAKMKDEYPNNVVKIVRIENDEDFYYVVTPLCECDLESFIKASSLPSQLQQIKLCLDILNGLVELHSFDIVHRDLKPRNVLINKKGDALLTDLGISRKWTGTSKNVTAAMGSQGWLASECITAASEGGDTRLTKASDIQVAGYLVYYILSNGFHPFDATGSLNAFQLQQNITAGKFQLLHLDKFPKECKSLLTSMLDKDVKKRPRIEDCLHKMKEVKTLLIQQLSEEIQLSLPGVEVLCGESSIDMTKDRNSKQTWSFRVKSGNRTLHEIYFCHNDSRELFFFPSPENQPRPKKLFAKDLKTDSEGYRCFEVYFQAKGDTGLFDEQVIFEFGEKPFLCQQLLVWINRKSSKRKSDPMTLHKQTNKKHKKINTITQTV